MPSSWTEAFVVRSFDVDPTGQMRIAALMRQMQNAADGHARSHGLALDQLLAQGKTWVLREFHLEVIRAPRQEERCTVITWAAARSAGARAWRDYQVLSEAGEVLAAGASLWLLLDTVKWRPIRLTPEVLAMVDADRSQALEVTEIPVQATCTRDGHELGVHWLDLDANAHVNNVRYVEWMLAAVPDATWERSRPQRFGVSYLDEARLGERLRVRWDERADGDCLHEVWNESGKLLCAAVSRWAGVTDGA